MPLKKSYRKRRAYKKRSTRKPRNMQATMRRIAKQVISREAEDKFSSMTTNTTHNSSISGGTECYALTPQVSQGDRDNQRIGDKIRGKYMYIKGFIQYDKTYLDVVGTASQYIPPTTARVLILSQKNIKVASEVQSRASVQYLLKDNVGTGIARSYSGAPFDNLAPINKDLFRVHMDKKIKFNWVNKILNSSSGVDTRTDILTPGNDRTKYFSCRIKCSRTLTFDDFNGDYPNTLAPFVCMGAVCDDGTSPYTLGQPYKMTILSTLYYEDS